MSPGQIVTSSFVSAWWLPGSHLQTLWPYLFRRSSFKFKNQRLELPDGDFVDLCWNKNKTGPIVVIFHGLEGSINSPYAAGLMSAIENVGWRGVLMHFRGCSGVTNRLDNSYHSGHTDDIRYLIDYLYDEFPNTPIIGVGFSLGGNAFLKYLGEAKSNTPISAAVAVSVPYLLNVCSLKLSTGFSKFYQWHLLKSLKSKVILKYKNKQSIIDISKLDELDTFYKFDDKITSLLNGFSGVDDYYSQASSKQYLSMIKAPTLLIHAKNDPFMTHAVLPQRKDLSASVTLEIADKGGHVGFVSGKVPWKPEYWLEKRILDFIKSKLT
jgi:uncharacterized protein